MRINNNLLAYNSHRQLGVNNKASQKSMERLSSGLRINRAGDDAAGLAISEKIRGQINGLKQAKRNAQDGISLLQTAEGALNETHSILQRMRELAVQASNDTNDSSDRDQIQKEINQLTSEINRIGNTTEFNTQKLLKGAGKLEGLGSSILSAEVFETSGGHTKPATSAKVTVETKGFNVGIGASFSRELEVSLNDKRVQVWMWNHDAEYIRPYLVSDPPRVYVKTAFGDNSADQIATYIKDGLDALLKIESLALGDFSITVSGNALTIESMATGSSQSISVKQVGPRQDSVDVNSSILNDTGDPDEYISAKAGIAFGNLSATDVLGKGITINNQTVLFTNTAGISSGTTDFVVNVDGVTDNESLVAAIVDQIGNELEGVTLTANNNTLIVTATAQAEVGNGVVISDSAALGGGANPSNLNLNLHVGANSGQAMNIELSDMRAAKLGLVGNGDGFTSDLAVTNGTSSELKERALDLSTHESSDKAITAIDNAIKGVSEERSKLGAYQNRLEHTISNLGTSAENLQAAESRIRDLDMSEEIMSFTKSNILSQAATAMLAQANMAPQSILQLLG